MIRLPTRIRDKLMFNGTCWQWTANINALGYGQLYWKGAQRKAHRIVYELLVGTIPKGLVIDHMCRNTGCVNPAHLEPVTQRENILRSTAISNINRSLTACRKGHEFTPENTYEWGGKRYCRKCVVRNQFAKKLRDLETQSPGV